MTSNTQLPSVQTQLAMRLVVVTGLSGAGKSSALATLEDLGFYCVDNLPVPLLTALADELSKSGRHGHLIAIGIDARSDPRELRQLPAVLDELRGHNFDCEILFLEADEETLVQRFSETRRSHPLATTAGNIPKAIRLERNLLAPLAEQAELRIDTRNSHVHQLRNQLRERFLLISNSRLSLQFQSFGFKNGVPIDSDFVFDIRCLPNPHWQPALRPLTGRDSAVIEFLEATSQVEKMKQDISNFLHNWICSFESEGRAYLTVSLGCTGGRHRSVYMAESLAQLFGNGEHRVTVRHRDLT